MTVILTSVWLFTLLTTIFGYKTNLKLIINIFCLWIAHSTTEWKVHISRKPRKSRFLTSPSSIYIWSISHVLDHESTTILHETWTLDRKSLHQRIDILVKSLVSHSLSLIIRFFLDSYRSFWVCVLSRPAFVTFLKTDW